MFEKFFAKLLKNFLVLLLAELGKKISHKYKKIKGKKDIKKLNKALKEKDEKTVDNIIDDI